MHPHCSFDLTNSHAHKYKSHPSILDEFSPSRRINSDKISQFVSVGSVAKKWMCKVLFSAYLEERRIIIVIIDIALIQYIILDIKVRPAESGVLMHISDEVAT